MIDAPSRTLGGAWSLVTCKRGGTVSLAAMRADGTLVAPTELKRWTSMLDLLHEWSEAVDILRAIDIRDAPDDRV